MGTGIDKRAFLDIFFGLGKTGKSSELWLSLLGSANRQAKAGTGMPVHLTPSTLSSANYLTVFESDLHSMKGAHNSYETRSYDLVVDNFSIWNVKRMWKKYGIPADKILVELHLLKNLGILICICINMYVLIYLHFVIGQFILG